MDISKFNIQRLNDVVTYASKYVLFYQNTLEAYKESNFYPDIWRQIPTICKTDIIINKEKMLSSEFNKSDLKILHTSGSTGKILEIYWREEDLIKSYLSLWSVRRRLYNILPSDKRCQFHSVITMDYLNGNQPQIASPRIILQNNNKVLSLSKLNLNDSILKKYYDKIIEFKPDWIYTQPSMMFIFCNFIRKYNLPVPETIKYIELTGEYLTEEILQNIKNIFTEVSIANNYGCHEVNGIAIQCECGNLHIMSDNVFVEIIEDNQVLPYGKIGNICITSLCNYAMPIIRYKLEDKAIMLEGNICSCGNKNPILEIKAGRANDFIVLKNKEIIDSVLFYHIVKEINCYYNSILQFQVQQKSYELFLIKLVLSDSSKKESIKKEFLRLINSSVLSEVECKIEFVENFLDYDRSGKLCYFKRTFNK